MTRGIQFVHCSWGRARANEISLLRRAVQLDIYEQKILF
jgi:hypothetical protein